MTSVDVDYLDGEHTITEQEPSFKELVKEYGEEFVRSYCIDNLRYRNKHPRVYKRVSAEVLKTFPKKVIKTEKKKDGSERKVYQSDIDHLRDYEKLEGKVAKDHVDMLLREFVPQERLYVKGERGSGKVSEKAIETANLFFAQGDEVVQDKVKVIESIIPQYRIERDGDDNVTVEGLARGIQALNKHLLKQAQLATTAALGT